MTRFNADAPLPCFAAGTLILTNRGEIPVEHLLADDLVIGMRRGKLAPVRRIGRYEVDLRSLPNPDAINPVRVLAGAFGPGQPNRDLVLSPDHALYVEGHLITVRHLLNGATIRQESCDSIAYHHVVLDPHEILLANGMTAGSCLDSGQAEACAPELPKGAPLAASRQKLLDRATVLGHATTPDPDLCVMAGGRMLRPNPVADGVQYRVPKGARSVRILSRCFVPQQIRPADPDCRRLGIGVTSIRLDGRVVELAGDRLGKGWHAAEQGLRWTNGEAWLRTGIAHSLVLTWLKDAIYWVDEPTKPSVPASHGAGTQASVACPLKEDRLESSARAARGAESGWGQVCRALLSALTSLPFRTFKNV